MSASSLLHRHRASTASCEPLETRRLMSVTYGTNLVVNPGAETYVGTPNGSNVITPTGWTANADPSVVLYNTGGFPTDADPVPPAKGKAFFAGGPDTAATDFFQTIDLSSIAGAVDAKQVKLALSAYLGGFSSQDDAATVFVNFQNASKGFVSQVSVGPVLAAARNNATALLLRSTTGVVPATARFAQVQIHFNRADGSYNDGYADNLSLVLTGPAVTTGSIAGVVYNDTNGNAVKDGTDVGLAGVKVFIDKNANGIADVGEPSTLSSATGAYSFTNVAVGSYKVRAVVPATYRPTSVIPASATVVAGGTAAANFFVSQTVLISGFAFNDANGNKVEDAAEVGLANVAIYLDFNNNGQQDAFELATKTDATGHYQFVLPFGTYTVRQVLPAGYSQTVAPVTLTLARGTTFITAYFGDKKP